MATSKKAETLRAALARIEKTYEQHEIRCFYAADVHSLRDVFRGLAIAAKRPDDVWDSTYAVEIECLRWGKIIVHGDIAPVVFGQHDTVIAQPGDLEHAIAWLGNEPLGSSYVVEKAVIGMRMNEMDGRRHLHRIYYAHAALRCALRLLRSVSAG